MNAIATTFPIDQLIQLELPAARRGDKAAYGRIVKACQNTVTSIAVAITRDVSSSEDIAQEAFINAWHHLERLQNPDSFLPWLRQITRNLARDYLRSQHHSQLNGPNAELAMALAADPGPQPVQRMIDDEYEATAFELISALPEDSREALVLFYREGQSTQQVAELLGISDAAARKRLSRARQGIRDDMLQRFGEFARGSAPSAAFVITVSTALATVSKPAAAGVSASVITAGTATASSAVMGKSLVGFLGLGLAAGASLLMGAAAGIYAKRYLLVYADTLEERATIERCFNLYFIVTMATMLLTFIMIIFVPNILWTLAAIALTMLASGYTYMVRLWRIMNPLIARDAARDPIGAKSRKTAYDYSWGVPAAIISNGMYPCGMLCFYGLRHVPSFVENVTMNPDAMNKIIKALEDIMKILIG